MIPLQKTQNFFTTEDGILPHDGGKFKSFIFYSLLHDIKCIMIDRNRRPTKLILKGTPDELASFTAKKILLIATRYANIPIVCEAATYEECKQLSHLARSLVMVVMFGDCRVDDEDFVAIATSRVMIKTIASLATNSADNTASCGNLMGKSVVDEAVIDGWMSFIWKSVDLPFQTMLILLENESRGIIAEAEKEGIEEDLKTALKKIEAHLLKQESRLPHPKNDLSLSIVTTGSSSSIESFYTLADLSLAITLHFMMDKNIAVSAMSSEENPYLYNWKETIHSALDQIPSDST